MPKGRDKDKRKIKTISTKPIMLIVCNGETEEKYINDFIFANNDGIASSKIKVIQERKTHLSLVDEIERRRATPQFFCFDKIWLVIDADLSPEREAEYDNYNHTIDNQRGFFVAWSNPCVEVWFLFHFGSLNTVYTTEVCTEKFNKLITKNGKNCCDKKRVPYICKTACDFSTYDKAKSPVYCFTEEYLESAMKQARMKLDNARAFMTAKQFHKINPGSNMHELLDTIRKTIKNKDIPVGR